jgi:iron complex outermembrane receptor protein
MGAARAQAPAPAAAVAPGLAELSLEELGDIEITSVSRRAERLSEAPASVFVITAEDIRRSGATSLPEALRLAPNLHVGRIGASFHAVSSRGFNSNTANKLLVLIDGRSVYTPLFGGVFWDAQQLPMQEIERIEVISGPAGTLWGVNAVNGVINITTRSATQAPPGAELVAGAGNRERDLMLRQGLRLGGDTPLQLWARHVAYEGTRTAAGEAAGDAGHLVQLGARSDWAAGRDRAMVQAQLYRGRREPPIPGAVEIPGAPIQVGPTSYDGGHLLARWERQLGAGGTLSLQGYWDHTERHLGFRETLDSLDLQLQHALQPGTRHALVWGLQLRQDRDHMVDGNALVLPERQRQVSYSLFAQDEVALRQDLRLTLGARAEHNGYTGMELLPSARLAWRAAPSQLVWGALSRTVRSPTRLDRGLLNRGMPPSAEAPGGIPTVRGSTDFESEVARVAELGWRGQPWASTSASATIFHADYQRLRSLELRGTELVFGNGLEGSVSGLELWGSWQARPGWRLHGGFTRLWQDLRLRPGSLDVGSVSRTEGANPARQWILRSQLDLPRAAELDLMLRGVSALPDPAVPSYVALDLRLGWRPSPRVEWSLLLQNLLDGGHGEFGNVRTRTEVGRAVFLQLVLRHEAL